MISISKSQVPSYLCNSEFYHSLDDDGGEISIPNNCFKETMSFMGSADLRNLLSTLRFWGVHTIPAEIVRFVLFNKIDNSDEVFAEFEGELVYLSFLRNLSQYTVECSGKLDCFAYHKLLNQAWSNNPVESCAQLCCAQYQYTNGKAWNVGTCKLAAEHGNSAMLRWLHEHGCPWDHTTCAAAAAGGRLDCLKYAHENGCSWKAETCASAARENHLNCLQYAHENGCPWDARTCINAIESSKTSCFEYAQERGCPWGVEATQRAAYNGNVALLKLLHESGCPWDSTTCNRAAMAGSLECLRYAHENGCAWDSETCRYAAYMGNLSLLQYAHDHGCPWNENTCEAAARNATTTCLQYAHQNGCPWDERTCTNAASVGNLSALAYAHENGCPWNSETTLKAAQFGQLYTLRYAHEHGCAWDAKTCTAAAKNGHLASLVYAHENGAPWDAATCAGAAGADNQSLACLQYAHRGGCRWDGTTCLYAAASGKLDCLMYAHENGCTLDASVCTAAVQGGNLACLQYAHEHGCPLDGALFAFAGTAASRKCIEYAKQHKCYPKLHFAIDLWQASLGIDGNFNEYTGAYYSQAPSTMLVEVIASNEPKPADIDDTEYLSLISPCVPVFRPRGEHAQGPLIPTLTSLDFKVAAGHWLSQRLGFEGMVRGYMMQPPPNTAVEESTEKPAADSTADVKAPATDSACLPTDSANSVPGDASRVDAADEPGSAVPLTTGGCTSPVHDSEVTPPESSAPPADTKSSTGSLPAEVGAEEETGEWTPVVRHKNHRRQSTAVTHSNARRTSAVRARPIRSEARPQPPLHRTTTVTVTVANKQALAPGVARSVSQDAVSAVPSVPATATDSSAMTRPVCAPSADSASLSTQGLDREIVSAGTDTTDGDDSGWETVKSRHQRRQASRK